MICLEQGVVINPHNFEPTLTVKIQLSGDAIYHYQDHFGEEKAAQIIGQMFIDAVRQRQAADARTSAQPAEGWTSWQEKKT